VEDNRVACQFKSDSSRMFCDIFYKSPVILSITAPSDGRIIEVNQAFLKFSEYSREELIGKTSIELGLYNDTMDRSRIIELLKNNSQILNFECRFNTKSGKEIFGLVSIVEIQINGGPYLFTTIIDIYKRIKAEVEIRDQFKELRRWHEAMLNREKRIMELKREVNQLLVSGGKGIKYTSVEDDTSGYQKPDEPHI
jgi:PAS domain S-box-containing protein